ncbi:MAG: tetratricopeptide repeat protein [Gemmatimonadetes bacterium]|nr:MAG: tetratricopeptide repeat protein [Gemmatimonadota bacterium]
MKTWMTLAGLLLLSGTLGARPQEAPLAVVVRVSGDVRIQPGGGDPVPAAVGARLAAGDRIVPQGGEATIVHRTGRTETVKEALTLAPPDAGEREDGLFQRTTRVLAQAARTDARGNPNRQGMIRPIPGEPVLVMPRNGIPVMDPRPTFVWAAVEGASGYTIQIRRESGGAPVRYRLGADTVWTLPPDAPPLLPGERYAWTVAPSGGRPTREQSFSVIGPADYGIVSRNLIALTRTGLDPASDGLLVAAAVYRQAGLLYEALSALRALEASGAPLSADVYNLEGEILDALGRLDEARRAFDRADAAR